MIVLAGPAYILFSLCCIQCHEVQRRVFMAEISGGLVRGRPRLGWMDGVNEAFGIRGMTVEAARRCVKVRKEWRALVHMLLNEFHAAIFAWPGVLSDLPPVLWRLPPREGWDAVT